MILAPYPHHPRHSDPEELSAAYERIDELEAALKHAQEAIFWYRADNFELNGKLVGEVIAETLS